ncbi:MAG: biotin--[acetyl-CoA-carboxylase] ligase [Bacteroidetes bacterium]|nr:biotin--[acetyl-CoA-carboxylase] ligase [Bacteroidota bacterium]
MLKNRNLLSHPAINIFPDNYHSIGSNFVELQSVDSTNNYAMAAVHAGLAFHGTSYFALEQTAGKGQRGKTWTTTSGENIIMSIITEPRFLLPMQQFFLSATIAISCYDFLTNFFPDEWKIKWPNDLYWRDRKAGGILIESICKGNEWLFAIVGIGININQVQFPDEIKNPVSLKQITGKTMKVEELAKKLCDFIDKRYNELRTSGGDQLLAEYNRFLYKRNETVRLKKGNIIFDTTIKEVNSQGQLITQDAVDRSFGFGEVEWL